MALRVTQESCRTSLDAHTALLNGGTIEIRTGSQPANAGDAATGTLLSTSDLSATAFQAAVNDPIGAAATANAIASTTADATGTAGWFRSYKSGGTVQVQDGNVGLIGSGADMEMNIVDFGAGGPVDIDSWVIRRPMNN